MPAQPKDTTTSPRTKAIKSVDPRVHEYIAPAYLDNLSKYRYSGADFSIIGNNIMQHWWSNVVKLVPTSVAPNMLTFLGLLTSCSGTLLLLYFYTFNNGVYPSWAWYYQAFSLFAYQTLDAIDGKQARRTGTGGPLGELFDHGCDAFFTPLSQISLCLAMDFSPMQVFWVCCIVTNGLFITIWEQYSTGTLDMGYINGPTDGILILCGMYLTTANVGNKWWSSPMTSAIAIPEVVRSNFPFFELPVELTKANEIFFIITMLSAAMTGFTNVLHVLTRPTVQTNKFLTVLYTLPMFSLLVGYYYFVQGFDEVHQKYLFVGEVAFGLCASFCATRLTLSRLCLMPYNPFNKLTVVANVFFWGCVATRHSFPWTDPIEFDGFCFLVGGALCVLCAGAVLTYKHMAMAVFRQLTAHLNLNLLTFTDAQKKKIAEKMKSQ